MRKYVFLATSLLALLFSCSTKKEQEEVIIQSLTHEVLMGDEYLIGKTRDLILINDSLPVVVNSKSENVWTNGELSGMMTDSKIGAIPEWGFT